METTLYLTIKVEVQSKEMKIDDLIDKFESDCDYNIIGTDDIKVVNTEYLETNLNN